MTYLTERGASAPSTATSSGSRDAAEASVERARVSGPRLIAEGRKEKGFGLDILKRLEAQYPGDPRKQLNEFLREFKYRPLTGRIRNAGLGTLRAYRQRLNKALNDLAEINARPRNLSNISKRNAEALVAYWIASGHQPKYIKNLATALRRLLVWMGKESFAALGDWVSDPAAVRCQSVARKAKTLEAAGIDIPTLLKLAYETDKWEATKLEFQIRFGLRVTESLMLKPYEADGGATLLLDAGTKGGRQRTLKIDTPEKRDLVDRARQLAGKGVIAANPRLKLDQARNKFYKFSRKIGLTQQQMGATPHSCRHTAMCAIFKAETGHLAPVEGGARLPTELVRNAERVVAKAAGHNRPDASRAYIGKQQSMSRLQRHNLEKLTQAFRADELLAQLQRAGIEDLWILGEAAGGRAVGAQTAFAYSGSAGAAVHDNGNLLALLAGAVGAKFATLVPIETARALNVDEFLLTGVES